MSPVGPFRRLGWTVLLTVVATILIFAFDPVPEPWPGRYLDWLGAVARLEFLAGREDQAAALATIRVPYSVWLTMAVACTALMVAVPIVFAGIARRAARPGRSEPSVQLAQSELSASSEQPVPSEQSVVPVVSEVSERPGRIAAAVAALALLGWLAGTFGSVAGWLGGIAGADVLPTTVMGLFPPLDEPLRLVVAQLHQLVFPSIVVAVALVPGTVWWCRRITTGTPKDATAASMRTLADLLPVFVAAAVLVELARDSYGSGQLLIGRNLGLWFEDSTPNIASAVLLLGLTIALTRLWLAGAAGLIALLPEVADPATAEPAVTPVTAPATDEPVTTAAVAEPAAAETAAAASTVAESAVEEPVGTAAAEKPAGASGPESFGQLWRRVRADRAARVGLWLLAGVGLAVCYARLWFDVGPTDIVSTDAPRPPSAQHWLGVDTLGQDQLVRVAAATAGSAFVIAGAATVATLAGLLLVAIRLPRRWALVVATFSALTAVVWLLANFGDPSHSFTDPGTHRLDLAVALGALAAPLTTRILARRRISPGPAVGAWLAACAATVPAEQLATLLVVKLDHRSPTLGAALAQAVAGSDPANLGFRTTDPAVDHPWLWYPPAVVLAALAVATTLLAVVVLTRHNTATAPSPSDPGLTAQRL